MGGVLHVGRQVAVPCASLLKPLYAWASSTAADEDVEAAIRRSDNAATDRLVAEAGGLTTVLDRVHELTGVAVEPGRTWGQVRVTAIQVETAYDALAAAALGGAAGARAVVEHMRGVVEDQRFGAPPGMPIKAGWDLEAATGHLLVHVVVLRGEHGGRGARARAILTRTPGVGGAPVPFEAAPALAFARAHAPDLAGRAARGSLS